MKRLCLFLILIAMLGISFAAIDDSYSFNATQGTYAAITGTAITTILADDALSEAIPIGFTFPYGDFSYTQVKVSSNGWVGLGTAQTSSNLSNQLNSTTFHPVVAPLWDDLNMNAGSVHYLTTGTTPNRIFTVQFTNAKWNYTATNQFSFQVKLYENGKIDIVYGPFTGTPSNASASIGINMSPGGAGWFYSVTPGANATASTTVENSMINTFPASGTIYEFLPAVAVANDLMALSITGNVTPSVNNATNYTVNIRNRGTAVQTNYQVQIVNAAGSVLASVPGQTIQPNQVMDVVIPWTPTQEGPVALRGKTSLTSDQNPQNDQSPPLNVTVMPAGLMVVTIGEGNQTGRFPVDMFYMNSLFQTLYYPQEMGVVGNISAITFYNNFTTNLPNKPTKIWLGTTTQENLSGGWIPSSQLTLVYDGNVNYPSGQNNILIPLQSTYTYTGGNLVMMVNRPMDTQYFSSADVFATQTVGTNRALNIFADGTTYDPANPPAGATPTGSFPKTSFHLSPLGTDPITLVNPSIWNVGTVLMNTTHNRNFTVLNGGGGTLGVNSISISGSPHFTLQNLPTLPASLTTGQSVSFGVQYLPTTAGTHTATLTVTDNITRQTTNIPITANCIDATIYTLPHLQNFDGVTVPNLPVDWSTLVQTNSAGYIRTVTTTPFSAPNCVEIANSGDGAATMLLIAPPFVNTIATNTARVNFRGRAGAIGYPIEVGVMTNPMDASTFQLVQSVNLNNTWTEHVVSFAAYTGTGRFVAFRHGLGGTYRSLFVDNVMFEYIPQNDLAATAIAGNQTPSVNSQTFYTVSVYNWGTATQSNYQVKLFNGSHVEQASVPGVTVASGATVQIQLPWTPTIEGPAVLYGKVVLTGDQNPLNDSSPNMNLTVMPAGMMVITIGDGNQEDKVPIDMYWRNSLFETIYYPQEIGAFGTITALTFYNNFVTNLPNKPTKIWLGSTTQDNLSGGWIPSTQLTLVFDGTVNYPSGQNNILIPLQTPYPYTGGNLVMMVNRPMDTQYFNYMDNFYAQTVGTNRSLKVNSDGTEYDPANPPAGVTPTGLFPKTTMHLTPLGTDPIFMINPTSRNYGTVLLNSTHNQNFTIMNVGGGTLGINSISIAGSEHFTIQNMPTLPASLNTGQSITFTGRYNPAAAGTHAATITIVDNVTGTRESGRSSNSRQTHTVALNGICVDPTINELPYLQNFDTVTAPALPVQWTKIVSNTVANVVTSTATPYSAPNSILMTNTSDAAATVVLVAPPYATTIPTNTTRAKFWARATSTTHTLAVGILTNPQVASTFTSVQTLTLSTTWTEYVVTFSGYQGTGRTVAFKLGEGVTYQNVYLDNIMLEVTPQNDLAALSVSGNTTPSVGMNTTYTVNVFNWGTNVQNNYLVKLFRQGDVEVSSIPGPQINPGQLLPVQISWAPETEGTTSIYGKVVLTGDQNTLNDQSPSLTVSVQPAGLLALTIGDGSQMSRIPVDMFYRNSLFQTIYYPAELSNTIGMIYGVAFYNNFSTNLPSMPTKIWLGTTTQADLSAGWIPSTAMTLVYDGNVNYLSGENTIHISFPIPYLYLTGENLVMMVNRPMDTTYYSSTDQFQAQTVGTNRSRNMFSDSTTYDPTAPTGGTVSGQFPKTTFFVIPGGVGHLNGTITGAGGQPLPGVAIQFTTGGYSAVTNAQGQYNIQNIIDGTYQVSFSRHGYITHSQQVVIPEDTTVTLDLALQQMPMVTVSGTLTASDTGAGIPGAGITLLGYENYTASTNTQGQFSISTVFANQTYNYTIIAPGYQNASGQIVVGATNHNMGTIVLNEVAYAPRQVQGTIVANNTQVELAWLAPDPTALDLNQSFESATFPPSDWSNVITNTGPANTSGVYPTWCRFGSVTIAGEIIAPTDGSWQAGLWWDYNHQDEWLITPLFNCPPSAYLRFDSHVFLGSDNGDHYYIKISTDGGSNWTVLWDASAQTGGWNSYDAPITIDLSTYEGLQVKLAWHATDPATNDGIWYVWFIDNVYIGNDVTSVFFTFDQMQIRSSSTATRSVETPALHAANLYLSKDMAAGSIRTEPRMPAAEPVTHSSRALIGYRVWRLVAGQETNETSWTSVTPELHTTLTLTDSGWGTLANGTYRWAVKAVYTSDVMSVPSFSNPLVKQVVNGTIAGVVRTTNNQPISGATVTAGAYSATTNLVGAYSILLPIGSYSVTASKQGYQSQTIDNVQVNANQTTTLNYVMNTVSNDDEVLPVVATVLGRNFPNPFNPSTTISFAIKDAVPVRLDVYNLKGQLIRTLVNEEKATGRYKVEWNGKDNNGNSVSSGIYLYRMNAGSYSGTYKMLLVE